MITNIAFKSVYGILVVIAFLQLSLQGWPSTKRHIVLTALFSIIIYFTVTITSSFITKFAGLLFIIAPILTYLGTVLIPWPSNTSSPNTGHDPIPGFYDARNKVRDGSIADRMMSILGFDPLLLFFLLLLLPSCMFFLNGFIDALKAEGFYLYEYKGKTYAVIRESGKFFISALYDGNHSIKKEYYIVSQELAEKVRWKSWQ
jgi:hypothetical protein